MYRNSIDAQGDFTAGTAASVSLEGRAAELYLCAKTANCYFDLKATATAGSATYLPKDSPVVIPCQHPSTVSAIGTASGTIYVIEFF